MCDMQQEDFPIVYASDAFQSLTGYAPREVIGHNCRFLQAPGGHVFKGAKRKHISSKLLRQMGKGLETGSEVQLELTNFKKDGTRFTNILTMIPVRWSSTNRLYYVGFQCDKDDL
jgi:PAS domain S-box-containing protein